MSDREPFSKGAGRSFQDSREATEITAKIKALKSVINRLKVAVFIYDLKKPDRIWTNAQYYRMAGYRVKEIQEPGLRWEMQNCHPDDLHILKERSEHFRRKEADAYSGMYRLLNKLGSWTWVYFRSVVYSYDRGGYPRLIMGLCVDFTDHFMTFNQVGELNRENSRNSNRQQIERLTKREKEVVNLIAGGMNCRQISEVLHISPHTTNNHRKNILRKLEMHQMSDIVHFAMESGLDK